jgi:hypothetical protein
LDPPIELEECPLALQPMPFLAIANFAIEGRQQIEGDIRRLKIPGISVGDVMR